MRNKLKEYYPLSKEELEDLWENGIFIFDTNALLNLFVYSKSTREDFLNLLENIKDRLWIPFQVALEFHNNIYNKVSGEKKSTKETCDTLTESLEKVKELTNNSEKAVTIDEDTISKFEELTNDICTKIENSLHHDIDETRDKISDLYEGKVGEEYEPEVLMKHYDEAEKRYKQRIPPGYQDAQKPSPEKYGDYIIWRQILDNAKQRNKIIFITDDKKEDWWRVKSKGNKQKLGPRVELIKEFRLTGGDKIHFYDPSRFLKKSKEYLKIDVSNESIDEAKNNIDLHSKLLKQYFNLTDLDASTHFTIKDSDILYNSIDKGTFNLSNIGTETVLNFLDNQPGLKNYIKNNPSHELKTASIRILSVDEPTKKTLQNMSLMNEKGVLTGENLILLKKIMEVTQNSKD